MSFLIHMAMSCLCVFATTNDFYYERYEQLAEKFPEAFSEYTRREFLVPTHKAKVSRPETPVSTMIIDARETPWGRASDLSMRTRIYAEFDLFEKHIALTKVEISPRFANGYAWRVLLAELLFAYPAVTKISIVPTTYLPTPDLAGCADLLARGVSIDFVISETPLVVAAETFGFTLGEARAGVTELNANESPYWPGEIYIPMIFVRP